MSLESKQKGLLSLYSGVRQNWFNTIKGELERCNIYLETFPDDLGWVSRDAKSIDYCDWTLSFAIKTPMYYVFRNKNIFNI